MKHTRSIITPYQIELIAKIFTYVVLVLIALVMAMPMLWLIVGSLKTNTDFFSYLFLPSGDGLFGVDWQRLSVSNFSKLIFEMGFSRYLFNSFFLASVSSVLATVLASLGGYGLAKFDFRGKSAILVLVLVSIILPAPLLLAPIYQLLYNLNLLNSYWGLILPGIAPAFGIFLFRQAMLNSVPTELLESARIDGCSEWRIFFTVVLPIIRPMLGAFLLINFLSNWNNFIMPQVILQDDSKFPLSVAIAQLRGSFSSDYALISAGVVMSVMPVMALFLLLQREFISGLTSGAVKG